MPFDPTKPANATKVVAAELRAQFNGLKDLIDAIPAGPPGPEGPVGPVGPVFADIQIGTVTTVPPLSPAGASVNVTGNVVELSFTIPRGDTGPTGEVSSAMLATEIAGTALNPSTVSDLMLLPSDPPTQADLIAVIAKVNELITALRRQP